MLFIEINGEKYPMKGQATTTQSGKKAIKIISKEAPLAMDGFKIVNEKGNVITDEHGNITGFVGSFKHFVEEIENGVKTLIEKIGTMIDVFFATT